VDLQVRVPGNAGDWSIQTQLADSAEAVGDAIPGAATVAGGGTYDQGFTFEGWQSMTPITGGKRYWVEVTAQPSDDSTVSPITLIQSIVARAVPATITIRPQYSLPATLPAGSRVSLVGAVDRAPACPPDPQWGCAPRITAQLQVHTAGSTVWRTVATASAGPGLLLGASVSLDRSADYRWYHPADGAVTAALSPVLHLDVHATGALTPPTSATVGHPAHASARITPADRGGQVTLQVLDGHWRKVTTGTVNSKGIARFTFTPKKSGTWQYRVYIDARPDLLAGHTSSVKLKVHRH
jgi:hypothetical protein